MMRTIFITIHDGEVAKNIFRTDLFKFLKNEPGTRFVLLAAPSKKEYYRDQFSGENVTVMPFDGFKLSFLQRIIHTLFVHALPVTTESVNSAYLISKNKRAVLKYAAFKLIYFFSHFIFFRKLLQKMGEFFLPRRPLDDLFMAHDPALVFATNILAYEDLNLTKEAQNRGIPVISMVKSWDTSSSKGLLRLAPDYLIAPNGICKRDMVDLHNFRDDAIFVAGFPQYDSYFRREGIIPREEFFASVGLDTRKRMIFYCAIGEWLFPNEHEIIEIIGRAIDLGKIQKKAQVLARPHPKYTGIDKNLASSENIIIDRGATYRTPNVEEWEFEQKDIYHLINALYHCDVMVTTASTMTIEGCIFDKPVINIAFDGYQRKSASLSVSRYYGQHHYRPITESGGVTIVRSETELVHALNAYLANPRIDTKGRAVIREMQCGLSDGGSGKRMARYILDILNTYGKTA